MTIQGDIGPGFKRTEVGFIPEDWRVSALRDLVDPSRGIRYGIVQPGPFVHNGRLLIRGQDYSKGWANASDMYRVGDLIESRYRNARVTAGDLIITIVGASTGHIEEVPGWLDTANLTQTTARIAIDRRKAEPRFAKYILASSLGESHVANYVKGGAQPGLNCGDVEKFLIPHPPSIEEQTLIAAALSDADDLIAALEGMVSKKRDLKQAAMQHLLTGKTRLPGFSREWGVKRLGDLGSFLKGSGISRDQAQSGGIPCVRYGEIYTVHHDVIRSFASRISREVANTATPLRYGDLLFAGSGETKEQIGKCVALVSHAEAYAGGDIVILRPKVGDPFFLGYLMNTRSVVRQKANLGQGDAVVHISARALANVEVVLPDPTEQTAIAEVLSDMDADLATVEAQVAKARSAKQGMMQELLTGRVRLV